MSRSRLRPLDLALQIGDSFAGANIHGDGEVKAVDKPQERIDGAPGPRLREWWHYYQYAFAEYQQVDVIDLAVQFQNKLLSPHYRRRALLTARLIYGEWDQDGIFIPDQKDGSPVYDWLTLAQAEKAPKLSEGFSRSQKGELYKVVSSKGGRHDAAVETLEYHLQAPKNWRVTDW